MNIIDPISNKEYDLFSDVGKNLLKMYVNQLMTGGGGSRKSTRGGNPIGRGGKGKTYQRNKNTKSKTKPGNKSSRINRKTQQQQQHIKQAQEKFIKKKLKHIEQKMEHPLYKASFKNIISGNIQPQEFIDIKDKLELPKKDDKYITMMLQQQIELSTYTAVGALKQTTIGLKGLMDNRKSWWERMLFAILFLSLFRTVAPTSLDINSLTTAEIINFGEYSYDYLNMVDKEREENDNKAAAAGAVDTHLSKSEGQKIIAEGYLKHIESLLKLAEGYTAPGWVIHKLKSIPGKIDNLGENKQLFIKGFMLLILSYFMYNMGIYHVATNRYII